MDRETVIFVTLLVYMAVLLVIGLLAYNFRESLFGTQDGKFFAVHVVPWFAALAVAWMNPKRAPPSAA